MRDLNKFSWLALTLLLITCGVLGWSLYESELSRSIVLGSGIFVLLIVAALSAPPSVLKKSLLKPFKTEAAAFVAVITGAFFGSLILIWIHIFSPVFILSSALLLAKLELQRDGVRSRPTFWALSLISIIGFSFGWMMHQYLAPLSSTHSILGGIDNTIESTQGEKAGKETPETKNENTTLPAQ